MHRQTLRVAVLAGALLAALAPAELVQAQTRTVPAQRLVCESSLNRDAYCRADTRDGVALVRSFGRERCTIGRNWGYDRNGIWVANGCKAEFAVGSSGNGYGWGWGNRFTGYVYCESVDNRRNECRINTRGGVRLINQVSRAACVQGRTWGHTDRSIWVGGGCRGEFEVNLARPDIPPPRPIPAPAPRPDGRGEDIDRITCGSDGIRREYCGFRNRGVRLVEQLSRAPCVEDRTWGHDRQGVWVERGCRAVFDVRDREGGRRNDDDRDGERDWDDDDRDYDGD